MKVIERLFGRGSERRREERRCGGERRGALRWDPLRKERRHGGDRRGSGVR
jgi:hypothetical protein